LSDSLIIIEKKLFLFFKLVTSVSKVNNVNENNVTSKEVEMGRVDDLNVRRGGGGHE